MNSNHIEQEILDNYNIFLSELEQITALLQQMMFNKYNSLDVYLNNCNHFKDGCMRINSLLAENDFNEYVKSHHGPLYNSYNSIIIAVRLYENFLRNCAGRLIKLPAE